MCAYVSARALFIWRRNMNKRPMEICTSRLLLSAADGRGKRNREFRFCARIGGREQEKKEWNKKKTLKENIKSVFCIELFIFMYHLGFERHTPCTYIEHRRCVKYNGVQFVKTAADTTWCVKSIYLIARFRIFCFRFFSWTWNLKARISVFVWCFQQRYRKNDSTTSSQLACKYENKHNHKCTLHHDDVRWHKMDGVLRFVWMQKKNKQKMFRDEWNHSSTTFTSFCDDKIHANRKRTE